ncbi:MAG: ribosomal protein small subunit ribosomal protein [Parcubacteria group bacterium]|nr:ribosomal protein small subunit ribosomal protein [Parcubacteria group bacterium]
MENTNPKPQTFRGTVVKTAMKDTATVSVSRYVKHPKYQKFQILTKKFLVDDKGNTAKEGDEVTIVACAPISKRKSFKIAKAD